MPVTGVPAFNAVSLLRIDPVEFSHTDVRLVAHGAFVNTANGATYGSTTCRRWSKHTLDKLAELRASMEQDLAALVFEQAAPSNAGDPPLLQQGDPGGIGEALRSGGDAPQV